MLIPVFLNEKPFQVEEGGTLGTLLAEHAPELLPFLMDGTAIATDGRGIPVRSDTPLVPGAIFLVKRSARAISDATHA